MRLVTEFDVDAGMPPYRDITQLGNIINWVDHEWIVVHVTTHQSVLALNGIEGTCKGGEQKLVTMAKTFEEENFTTKQLLRMMKVYVSDAFDPDFNMVYVMNDRMLGNHESDSRYDWFTNNSRRAVGSDYWTSGYNGQGGMYTVTASGGFSEELESWIDTVTAGFRPAVCIDLTQYTVS